MVAMQAAKPAPFSNVPTDEAIDFNRRMGARLIQQGTSTEPVGHWTAALARALQGMSGGMYTGQAAQGEQDAEASVAQALSGNLDPRTLMQNPRTRGMGVQMYASAQADARAEARERRAEERAARDPYRQAQIGALQAEAQAKAAREQRRSALMGELLGDGGGMPAQRPPMPQTAPVAPGYDPIPQQGGPRIQPQSNLSPDVMPGGVTRVSDAPQAPQAPQAAPQAQEPSVELFGRQVPVSRARSVGQRMLLDPETAQLGKAILDSIGPQSNNPTGLQKPTLNTIEEKQINAVEKLTRLEDIERAFNPKFLTGWEQAKQLGMSWAAWANMPLSPEQTKERQDFVRWQRRTIANVNATIKEITGAAMSEAEAKRIRMQEADLSNDPIQFKTQLDDALRDTRLALARMHILRREGFQGAAEEAAKRLSLSDVEGRMEQRFVELQKQIRDENPNITPQEMRSRVRVQLRAEFGVDA